jgi:CRISPR-associated endonuclease/helicase Cas3
MTDATAFPAFSEFLHAVTGHGPFPWQERLAEHVEREGKFPDAITVPTGLGKTTTMLVHLHALARDVHRNGPLGRTLPLRCFHIVERREVVDTSFKLAEKAAEAINGATDPDSVLYPVRRALSMLIPAEMEEFEPVVSTASLHGGINTRGDWLRPVGAQLITATVTQIASRALFRGVGVSPNTSPMHAAVTGMDRVILVDEPHLSEAAIAALRDAENVQRAATEKLGVPIGQTVILGATAPRHLLSAAGTPVTTDQADAEHPVAGRKLRAPKRIALITVDGVSAPDAEKKLTQKMAAAALEARERGAARGPTGNGGEHGVLVFANTVKMARQIFKELKSQKMVGGQLRLVHGRMRRWDRPVLDLAPGDITVATQTLEVGADIDGFEVITQICSLSALIQRAGRGNRYGNLDDARILVFASRVVKKPDPSGDNPGCREAVDASVDAGTLAVYGERAEALLRALMVLTDSGHKTIPAAPDDMAAFRAAVVEAVGEEVLDPPIRTAVLRPQVARFAAYTDPGTNFPLDAFLSGPDEQRQLDVTVAWRDSDALDLLSETGVQDEETVQIPLMALRNLLVSASSEKPQEVYVDDLDVGARAASVTEPKKPIAREILERIRLRMGRDWVAPKKIGDIGPGAMVVLDAGLGGYVDPTGDEAPGLDTESRKTVIDISEAVACANNRGRFLLANDELIAALNEDFLLDSTGGEAGRRVTEALRENRKISEDTVVEVLPVTPVASASDDDVQTLRFVIALSDGNRELGDNRCRTVFLADHGHQVGRWSANAAAVLPLRNPETVALIDAGDRHDLGKADRVFQAALGNRGVAGDTAWAKSRREHSRAERRRLREQVGLSADWRHEVAGAAEIDDPLTRHLVVSHHMWGRPLIVHPDDNGGPDSRITEHVTTFDTLTDTYGPWGLALLETLMRWADHRASAHPRTYNLDPILVSTEPLVTPDYLTTSEPDHQLRLPGLTASPMAGVLAAVGLLDRIVSDGLDPHAVIRWEPDTGVPVIGTMRNIRSEVEEMTHDTGPWKNVDEMVKELFGDKAKLTINYAKIAVPERLDMRGVADGEHLLHQILPDTQELQHEKGKKKKGPAGGEGEDALNSDSEAKRYWLLHSLPFHNNGSPFHAALHPSPTQHFFDTRAGYTTSADCASGGLDIHKDFYPGLRVRRDTLTWALAGNRALGWGAVNSVDKKRRVVLPVPARWTTVAGYRALASSGGLEGKGPSRAWVSARTRTSEQLKVWALIDDAGQ